MFSRAFGAFINNARGLLFRCRFLIRQLGKLNPYLPIPGFRCLATAGEIVQFLNQSGPTPPEPVFHFLLGCLTGLLKRISCRLSLRFQAINFGLLLSNQHLQLRLGLINDFARK